MEVESLTLVIETDAGTAIRRIPNASPLPESEAQGYAAENAVRHAAALWGLPDFVFQPEQERTGSGVRELGDGLLLVGQYAAVLQSKSRTEPSDSQDRELAWLGRNVSKALRQGSGTVRRLNATEADMTNLRGRTIPVRGSDYTWLSVVIVDHANLPSGFQPPAAPTEVPAVVILRRDWEFLFDHLRSTRAVLAYLLRVAQSGDIVQLGDEPRRFHEYAIADSTAVPDPVHSSIAPLLQTKPVSVVSSARAPLDPAAADQDAHRFFRMIMEDFASTPIPAKNEPDRLLALAVLDGLPVAYRGDLGRALLDFMVSASRHRGAGALTHSRTVFPNPGEFEPLLFIVASELSDESREALLFKLQLLHHDYSSATGDWDHCTLGILLTPATRPRRLWDTSTNALWGDQQLEPQIIAQLREYVAGRRLT